MSFRYDFKRKKYVLPCLAINHSNIAHVKQIRPEQDICFFTLFIDAVNIVFRDKDNVCLIGNICRILFLGNKPQLIARRIDEIERIANNHVITHAALIISSRNRINISLPGRDINLRALRVQIFDKDIFAQIAVRQCNF